MTTTPDFRELCADLVDKLDELNCNFNIRSQSALIKRANAALATPPPEPPTDEELVAFLDTIDEEEVSHLAMARAVLERWPHL
jgi:hypothetical protein